MVAGGRMELGSLSSASSSLVVGIHKQSNGMPAGGPSSCVIRKRPSSQWLTMSKVVSCLPNQRPKTSSGSTCDVVRFHREIFLPEKGYKYPMMAM